MFVYILRHAIAVQRGASGYPNDDRPLTEDGIEKMQKAARGIAVLIDTIDVILTSPLIRAHDTAKLVAEARGADHKIEICKELLPGNSSKKFLLHLAKYKSFKNVMIVGHEPDLGYIASALLGSNASIIEFKKGALCCIEVPTLPPRNPGKLHWHLQPRQLRDLKKTPKG